MSGPPARYPTGREVLLPSLGLALGYGIVLAGLLAAAHFAGALVVVDAGRARIAAGLLAVLTWLLARGRVLDARRASAALFNQARDYQDRAIHGRALYEPVDARSDSTPGPGFGPGV